MVATYLPIHRPNSDATEETHPIAEREALAYYKHALLNDRAARICAQQAHENVFRDCAFSHIGKRLARGEQRTDDLKAISQGGFQNLKTRVSKLEKDQHLRSAGQAASKRRNEGVHVEFAEFKQKTGDLIGSLDERLLQVVEFAGVISDTASGASADRPTNPAHVGSDEGELSFDESEYHDVEPVPRKSLRAQLSGLQRSLDVLQDSLSGIRSDVNSCTEKLTDMDRRVRNTEVHMQAGQHHQALVTGNSTTQQRRSVLDRANPLASFNQYVQDNADLGSQAQSAERRTGVALLDRPA